MIWHHESSGFLLKRNSSWNGPVLTLTHSLISLPRWNHGKRRTTSSLWSKSPKAVWEGESARNYVRCKEKTNELKRCRPLLFFTWWWVRWEIVLFGGHWREDGRIGRITFSQCSLQEVFMLDRKILSIKPRREEEGAQASSSRAIPTTHWKIARDLFLHSFHLLLLEFGERYRIYYSYDVSLSFSCMNGRTEEVLKKRTSSVVSSRSKQ